MRDDSFEHHFRIRNALAEMPAAERALLCRDACRECAGETKCHPNADPIEAWCPPLVKLVEEMISDA